MLIAHVGGELVNNSVLACEDSTIWVLNNSDTVFYT